MMPPEEVKKVNKLYAASVGINPLPGQDIRELISEHQRVTFEQTLDPLAPWRVITWAAVNDFPLPVWVIQHLCAIAQKINDVVKQSANAGSVKREAEAVGKALGFGSNRAGETTATKKAALRDRDLNSAIHIIAKLGGNGGNKDAAIFAVSRSLGVKEAMANRAFKRFGKQAKETLTRYLAKAPIEQLMKVKTLDIGDC
jgi:hypothetical protein